MDPDEVLEYFDEKTQTYRATMVIAAADATNVDGDGRCDSAVSESNEPEIEPNVDDASIDDDDDYLQHGFAVTAVSSANVSKPETHQQWFESSSGRFYINEADVNRPGVLQITIAIFSLNLIFFNNFQHELEERAIFLFKRKESKLLLCVEVSCVANLVSRLTRISHQYQIYQRTLVGKKQLRGSAHGYQRTIIICSTKTTTKNIEY